MGHPINMNMNRNILICSLLLVAASLHAAESGPKDDVINAAKKLGEKSGYSWKATVVVPDSAQFRPGPTEGKTEKDGYTHVTSTFGDNTMETIVKGEKGAVTNQDGDWQSLAEAEGEEGFGRFRAVMARNIKTPAVQAAELAAAVKELKKEGDVYSGELTEEGAKAQLRFGRTAEVSDAKGSVKFWLKDGELAKYEIKVKGTRSFNGNDQEVDRATTIEIKDVGTTKVAIPEAAKKKLS
jgi:hypothetical protein